MNQINIQDDMSNPFLPAENPLIRLYIINKSLE